MNQNEIMEMAKEAGFEVTEHAIKATNVYGEIDEELARFAALVAAKEREACARVCDAKAHEVRLWCNESNVIACAAAIRARGTKEGA